MFQLRRNSVIYESDDSRDSSAYLEQLESKKRLKISGPTSQQSIREPKLLNAKLNFEKENEVVEDFNPKIVGEIEKRFKVKTL